MYLEENGLPAVSAHNQVHVHVSTQKGDLSKAHVSRVWPSTQAPPSVHSEIWTAVLGMMYDDRVCYDDVCHCWHSLIALIACLQYVFARMTKQLVRPASRRRAYRPGVSWSRTVPRMKNCWINMARVCLHLLSRMLGILNWKLRMLKLCL